MSRSGRGEARTRVIQYQIEDPNGHLDDYKAERMLDDARKRGIVTEYDAGRGSFMWFNGRPGKALRAFRKELERAVRR